MVSIDVISYGTDFLLKNSTINKYVTKCSFSKNNRSKALSS